MKRTSVFLIMFVAMMLNCAVCFASIIPSQGPGQIGLSSVVLCNSLSLRSGPGFSYSTIQTLTFGDRIIVMSQNNGWAEVVLGDSEDSLSGWVDVSFIAVDPAWYRTVEETSVYAWNDTSAPRVALLDEGTTLPILRDDGDWIIVSLRGATGWIHNPDRTTTQYYYAGSSDTTGNNDTSSSGSTGNNTSSTGSTGNNDTNNTVSTWNNDTSSSNSTWSDDSGSSGAQAESQWFTVYSRDGSTVAIHLAEGAMYEDGQGRTYIKQDDDAYYYCITTDITYALDPTMWTGEAYGENYN